MKQLKVFLKLLPYIDSVHDSIIIGIITGTLAQLAMITCAAYGSYLVGLAILGASAAVIRRGIWILLAFILLRTLMSYLEMYFAHKAAYGILAQLRVKVYRAIERISPRYLLNKRTGELSSTLMSDVETLEWFYAHTYGAFIVAILAPLAVLIAIIILIHPMIALVLIPWATITATVPFWFKQISDTDGRIIRERLAEINAEVVDGIQGAREILSFGFESWYIKKLRKANRALNSIQLKYGKRQGVESGLLNLCMSLGLLSVTLVSILLIQQGAMARELYAVAVILAIYFFTPIVGISNMARNFGIMQSSTDRVFSVLETPETVRDLVQESEKVTDVPSVTFDHVSFRYGETLPLVLDDVSFRIKYGETVALVGHSGAGKSTCANLLLRFWDIENGTVKIGNVDVRNMTQHDLREMISTVPQDVYLFNCSILDNIRLGMPEATLDAVRTAAQGAQIDAFIMSLPEGYDTVVGERGAQLSGGERQRIAIARALLRDTPILLMDEAVSNLDTKNEEALQKAVKDLNSNRTTMVIAHRLSTILSADKIVVLDRGKVAQVGTHTEMMMEGGAYAELIDSQYMGKDQEAASISEKEKV